MCVLSCFSHVQLFVEDLWIVACQAPLSVGILQARMEWVAVLSSKDLPSPGIKPVSLTSPASAGGFFTARGTWEAEIS